MFDEKRYSNVNRVCRIKMSPLGYRLLSNSREIKGASIGNVRIFAARS